MPELPEVEHTARQLRETIVGATIADAQVFWERTIGYPDLLAFLAGIRERRIVGVRRRGKLLILDLSGEALLTVHRRMTGNLLLVPPGWEIDTSLHEHDLATWNTRGPTIRAADVADAAIEPALLRYGRACFNLADRRRLLYTDPRKFGRIALWSTAYEAQALEGYGIEPLEEEFTVEELARILVRHKGAIKPLLLNQAIIAGIGNIYADEALFSAAVHPLRLASSLSPDEAHRLHDSIVAVLSMAIEHGGTSFSEFRDLWGEAGENYDHMLVYQRDGQPCPRCGTPIERIVVSQRGTHYCPNCQRLTLA